MYISTFIRTLCDKLSRKSVRGMFCDTASWFRTISSAGMIFMPLAISVELKLAQTLDRLLTYFRDRNIHVFSTGTRSTGLKNSTYASEHG